MSMVDTYNLYRSAGFACVPTGKNKAPAVPKGSKIIGNWEDLKEYESAHGIGIICGSGLECLDFDNHFHDAKQRFEDFFLTPDVTKIYEKHRFAVQKTLNGGYHVIYKTPSVNGSEKLAMRVNGQGRAEALIETRGTGNYFCVDPTPGYKIEINDIFNLPVIEPEDRDVLFDTCRSYNEVPTIKKTSQTPSDERIGDTFNQSPEALREMTDALIGAGWIEVEPNRWRRPGKERGISATLNVVAPGLFYNFSANGDPFELKGTYSPFQVVSMLKYGGNNKAFAKELHERYKPQPPTNSKLEDHDFLIGKTANQWLKEASQRPIPKMLLSELWHETEFCIFFSTSGNGKSATAVQIGNAIASGIPIPGFKMEATPQTVLYFDFELSDKQFEQRYSDGFSNHFIFDDKFIRFEIDPEGDKPEKMTIEEFLIASIEKRIKQYNSKILLIDNLTYLSNDSEKAKEALPLMKKLKELKKKYDLSILALAHTPKRDESKPIGKNDLFGSSMIYNFCDSCFAIGKSTSDESLRYIKQIKERFTSKIYDSDNVIVCQIEKPYNCLQLTYIGYGKETDYLKNINENEKEVIKEMVQHRHREGKSYREIAREFNLSLNKVQRIIKPKVIQ
jgi:hypothetical protein